MRHPFRAPGVGALPPPNGHVGGEYALLGEPGELGWEGCSNVEILLSSCGLNPPTPARPCSASPAKHAPLEKPKPPAAPPPKPTQPNKTHPPKRKSFESGSSSSSNQALPHCHGKGKGEQPEQQKRREVAPYLKGVSHLTPCLVNRCMCPTQMVSTRGFLTSYVGGGGGRVWMEHPGEKKMFWVERHLLYASHGAAVTPLEPQKAAAADKKAAKAKKKPNPKPDGDPPAEPATKPAKPDPQPETKQAPQHEPKAAPQAAPMEVDVPSPPSAEPSAQPPALTHAQAPDRGETKATSPLGEAQAPHF